ncbi:MAG TPA: FAD-dependent oxidoreductase, partial [Oligoflexia bacterium]|nr:FAD-dependent oxidoreductase [Oligoflexia bacterium]
MSDELFDVIVIGGGINGAAVAWDLSLRGYRTLLVEKADFGSAASAGCFKIAHGGLRYLQHLDLPRLWESANEQRILRQIAPHFIHPLPFLIPCYGRGMKSRAVLDFALSLYELLACKRNKSVDRYHMLASHAVISSEHCLRIAPGITPYKLRAGVVYYDCQISNCERLTYSVIRSAADAGACMLNYVEATGFETRQAGGAAKAIDAVRLRDLLSGREFRVRAKIVV